LFRKLFKHRQKHDLQLSEAHPKAAVSELFVPDGHLALHIQDGKPDRWFQPGRHELSTAKAKVEVRLILMAFIRDQDRDQWELALNLPYERALLFVDGVQVGIVKPGSGGARKSLAAFQEGNPASLTALRSDVSEEEEEPFQDFSFV
jgi:deferrochelatase/peroxidase EfeB